MQGFLHTQLSVLYYLCPLREVRLAGKIERIVWEKAAGPQFRTSCSSVSLPSWGMVPFGFAHGCKSKQTSPEDCPPLLWELYEAHGFSSRRPGYSQQLGVGWGGRDMSSLLTLFHWWSTCKDSGLPLEHVTSLFHPQGRELEPRMSNRPVARLVSVAKTFCNLASPFLWSAGVCIAQSMILQTHSLIRIWAFGAGLWGAKGDVQIGYLLRWSSEAVLSSQL